MCRINWRISLWSGWTEALIIVKPETVVSWHRGGFRLLAIAVEVPPTGTTEGQHTINMTRKGQVRWVSGTNVRRQFQYINQLVDLAV